MKNLRELKNAKWHIIIGNISGYYWTLKCDTTRDFLDFGIIGRESFNTPAQAIKDAREFAKINGIMRCKVDKY